MSYPQSKRPSSDELIDKHSVARYITRTPRHVNADDQARAQVKRYR